MINRANDILRWYVLVIEFNTFNYVKLWFDDDLWALLYVYEIVEGVMFLYDFKWVKISYSNENDVKSMKCENCVSVWKQEHVWCKSRKHKHVHGTTC
jgi:hypothetical protein